MTDLLNSVQGLGGKLLGKGQAFIDSLFPPEKRAELMAKLQSFALNNPKLAAFLLCQIALTGFPLAMFIVFTITVFVFSLVAALLIGILVALGFTVLMVGTALLVVLPTVFLTTMAATFVFLWGLGGYYILKWFNKGDSPSAPGAAIGDKLNNLTGGRMSFLMDTARANEAKAAGGDKEGEKAPAKSDHGKGSKGKGTANANGGVPGMDMANASEKLSKGANDVTKHANVDAVPKKLNNVTNTAGTAKGAIGGATGLT